MLEVPGLPTSADSITIAGMLADSKVFFNVIEVGDE
jgi:hypothetical protein